MIPRCTWAARQLELHSVLHISPFLIPALSLVATPPTAVRSCRDLSSTSTSTRPGGARVLAKRRLKEANVISDVLVLLEDQLSDVVTPLPSDSCRTPSSSTRHLQPLPPTSLFSASRPIVTSFSLDKRHSSTSAFADLRDGRLKKERGLRSKGKEKEQGGEERSALSGPEEDGISEEDGSIARPPHTSEPWPLVRLPPLPSHTTTSPEIPFEPPIPPTPPPRPPRPRRPPPPPPKNDSPIWNLDLSSPPTDRAQLVRLLSSIPLHATEAQLLSLRHLAFTMGRLDDSLVIQKLVLASISCKVFRVGLRLLKESCKLMIRAEKSQKAVAWVFEKPLEKLERRERWDWIISYSDAAVNVGAVSDIILELRIRALYEAKRYQDVVKNFGLYRQYELEPPREVYDNLAGAHLLNGNAAWSQEVLAAKYEKGFGTSVKTCLALLDGMWMYGGNRALEDKILNDPVGSTILSSRKAIKQDPRVLNRIISVRAARGDTARACEALFTHFSLPPSPSPLDLVGVVPPRVQGAAAAPTSCSYWRPSPDIATFTILMGMCLRHKRLDSALSLFAQSQELGLGLNEHVVAALVRILLAYGDGDVSIATDFVFNLANGKTRLPGQILVSEAFEPTPLVFEVLLGGVLRSGGLQGASALLRRVIRSGRKIGDVTEGMVAVLVEHLTRTGDDVPVLRRSGTMAANLIVKIQTLTKGLRKPTIRNLNALLELAWRRERFQSVLLRKSPRRREPDGSGPRFADLDTSVVSLPPSPHPAPPFPSSMSRVKRSIQDRGLAPDRVTAQQVLRAAQSTSSIDGMWEYVQTQLLDKSIIPTFHHFLIIMRAYLRAGDIAGARDTIARAKLMGVPPHAAMYSVLIGGASRLGRMDEARRAYSDLKTAGLVPDRQLYAALALSFARLSDFEGVESIITEATSKLNPPLNPVDPVFVGIQYRALVSSGRLYQAQVLMRKKLMAGLVPDLVLVLMLKRTKKWLNWKANSVARGLASPISKKTARYHAANLKLAKLRLLKANEPMDRKKLKELEGLLALHATPVGKGRVVNEARIPSESVQ